MALNWDVSKVEDKDWVWVPATELYGNTAKLPIGIKADESYLNPKVESIIWACMLVDMNGVTHENKIEFYLRYIFTQRMRGYDLYFSFKDLERTVGLSTNVMTLSTAKWKKEFFERESVRLIALIGQGNYDTVGEWQL